MKLLIVEDDCLLAQSLKRKLSNQYAVNTIASGNGAISKLLTNEYDLIILDLTLPDLDGLEICKTIRKEGINTPMIILTGKNSIETKVELLNAGADDYMIKPFDFVELKARIRAIIRRENNNVKKSQIRINKLIIDLEQRSVLYNNNPIKLSKKEYLILQYLVHNKNIPISRFKIAEHIWENDEFLNSNTIDVHIFNMRSKFKKVTGENIIKTVHGIGYKV